MYLTANVGKWNFLNNTGMVLMIVSSVLLGCSASKADGNADAGAATFKVCATCHEIGEGAKKKVGPILTGVVGRTAGSIADYNYSSAMEEAGQNGLVWTKEALTVYLAAPKKMVPGIKMTFPGFKNPEDIANVVAYLEAQ